MSLPVVKAHEQERRAKLEWAGGATLLALLTASPRNHDC
jgi:hypothetical protein